MSLSRRNKRKKPCIVVSNFYARYLDKDPLIPWGLLNMNVYISKRVIEKTTYLKKL